LAGSAFAGKTPLKLPLAPDVTHVLRLSKNGYESHTLKVQVEPGQNKALSAKLVPQNGVIRLHIEPADAELWVDGVSRGKGLREIQLIAVEHQLDIRKAGYESHQTRLTPKPGFPQLLRVVLNKTPATASAAVLQAGNGYRLALIPAGTFVMGASRREQGRRSNETLRKIILQRPFYMGLHEVTNEQFRLYTASHHSGKADAHSLNLAQQPVAQVTWAQAAGFANWLSVKDGLPPVYMRQGETYVAIDPLPIGYRLCTEAEWEYTGRYAGNNSFVKFPWGSAFPPPAKAGNFADRSAKDIVANYLERYDDTYPVSSPAGRFQANALGIYDMGGNVAEWSHDYYAIVPSAADGVQRDPVGPKQGTHHVIKGASWKHASISALRLSYRDYGNAKRADVGFRLCRYAKAVGDKP
jgi:formylglycine-generating enzyme required for sulfatase activity